MPEEYEFDPSEHAKELAANQDLGRGDYSEPRPKEESGGMTRRDLLVRGGVGAAAIGGLGAPPRGCCANRYASTRVLCLPRVDRPHS